MTSPASACEEVGHVSWALKKEYYYTTEMQSWYAKMGWSQWAEVVEGQVFVILCCKRDDSEQILYIL